MKNFAISALALPLAILAHASPSPEGPFGLTFARNAIIASRYTAGECREDGPVNLVVMLEYEVDYLYAWVVYVDFELQTCPVVHAEVCERCGEGYEETTGTQAYRERIRDFLQSLVKQSLDVFRTSNDWNFPDTDTDNIRAVVIAGEASQDANVILADLARTAIGSASVRIMSEMDASEVVAYAAAVEARKAEESPLEYMVQWPRGMAASVHDEL